jgi:hypothetical protein
MENYLHFEAINEAYELQSDINLGLVANFEDFDDVPAKIAELVHNSSDSPKTWSQLENDLREKKISRAKRTLNHVAASLMTKERLDQIDPDTNVLTWFQQMNELVETYENGI